MSITTTMYTGVSGLNAEGDALGVVGDNIANSNTVGFKSQRAVFEDMLGRSMTGEGPGAGVQLAQIQQLFTQGALTNTGVSTDLSISGDGFFVMNGNVNGVKGDFYSRAGQLSIDNTGALVNPEGLNLQGYPANPDGTFSPTIGSVKVPTSSLAPQPSTKMTTVANLDAGATPPAAAWDPANPTSTSNFSTAMTVYDSLGKAHDVSVYFNKTGANTWAYHAVADGGDLTGGTPGTNVELGNGTLTFGANGSLSNVTTTTPISANFANAAPGQAVALNFGSTTGAGGSGTDGLTQYAAPSSVASQGADGYAAGDLVGVTVDGQGVVRGAYSNGQKIAIAEVAIAKFTSNDGLARAGQDMWSATQASGAAAVGTAGVGGRGSTTSGTLEQSNVDIATQFVDLIAHQRAFQANSKTITTADEMMQDLVNIIH